MVCRAFGTVSYYIQKLFSEYQGVSYIDTVVSPTDGDPRDYGVAASASCLNEVCTRVALKVRLPHALGPAVFCGGMSCLYTEGVELT